MANDVIGFPHDTTGSTLYAIFRDRDGEVWNGSEMEAYQTANLGDYDVPLTEQGTASRYYAVTVPGLDAGLYSVAIYEQAGASPAEGDTLAGVGGIEWDGTKIVYQSGDTYAAFSGGSGANAVTITAKDADGNPLAGVAISVELSGVETNTVTTDENGEAVFSLAAGTWEVRGYKSGYQHTPENVSVSGETAATITLTQIAGTPSADPDKSAVTITCYGTTTNTGDGTATEAGVTLQVQQTGPPSGDENHAFDGSVYEYTSDVDGVVSLTLWRNAPYRWRRGTSTKHSPWYAFTPDAAAYDLTSRVGSDV